MSYSDNRKYTNRTKKLWDLNIAADIQEWSELHIYVYMFVIKDILKASTQNGKKVVTHITHMMHGRKGGHFQFHTFSEMVVYR